MTPRQFRVRGRKVFYGAHGAEIVPVTWLVGAEDAARAIEISRATLLDDPAHDVLELQAEAW